MSETIERLRAEVERAGGGHRGYLLAAEKAVVERDALRAEVERLRADGTIASLAVAIARAEKAEAALREVHAWLGPMRADSPDSLTRLYDRIGTALLDTAPEDRSTAPWDAWKKAEAEVKRLRDIISPSAAAAYEEGMAALEAERDALRAEVGRLERARLRSADWVTLDKAEAERDALRDEVERLREEQRGEAVRRNAAIDIAATRAEKSEAALREWREWREAESSPDCIACCTLDAALAEAKP
jgi:hypothetical protein